MKIGIVSDTHNNMNNTRWAADILRDHGVEHVIHCGDLTTPAVVELFADWPVSFVFGNMDRDRSALSLAVQLHGRATIGESLAAEFEGVHIAACHGDHTRLLDSLIYNGLYGYVFHGHTHERRHDTIGSTQVVNPGALGGTRRQARSLCILDPGAGIIKFVRKG